MGDIAWIFAWLKDKTWFIIDVKLTGLIKLMYTL